MKIRNFKRGLTPLFLLVAAVLAFSSSANAGLVTQLIHFDDASNGDKWYSDVDKNFLFDPTNLQSSSLCADSTDGGNGSCVIEGTQGVLPQMTRPETGPQSQGSTNQDPIVSGDNLAFTLDSFYFLLTGKGRGSANAITVEGYTGVTLVDSFTFELDGIYAGPIATDPVVTFYEGTNAGNAAGALVKDTGYIVTFGDLFKDVTSIQFSAPTTAQVRLDCVVATFDGTTSEPLSGFTNGCGISSDPGPGPGPGVPVPAPLALFGLGGLILGWSMKRSKSRG